MMHEEYGEYNEDQNTKKVEIMTVSLEFSSAQYDIYALGKAHMRYTPSLHGKLSKGLPLN